MEIEVNQEGCIGQGENIKQPGNPVPGWIYVTTSLVTLRVVVPYAPAHHLQHNSGRCCVAGARDHG